MSKKQSVEKKIKTNGEKVSQANPRGCNFAHKLPYLHTPSSFPTEISKSRLKNLISIQQLFQKYQQEREETQQKLELALQQLEHYDDSFALLQEENSRLRQMQRPHDAQEDKKKAEERLLESLQHIEQLERVIYSLKENLEGTSLERQQLKEAHQKAQEAILKLTVEKDQIKSLLAEEQQAKVEALEEITALSDQFSTLKTHVYEAEKKAQTIQQELDTSSNLTRSLQEEVAELQRIKMALEDNLQKEAQLSQQLKTHSQEISKKFYPLKEELCHLQSHTKQTVLAHLAICSQLTQSQKQLKEKESKLQDMQQSLASQVHNNQQCEQLLETLQTQIQELEASLQSAQLHLAKKVREVALYQESYEEQKMSLCEMEKAQLQYKEKMAELQQTLDDTKQIEHRLEEQAKQWEHRYLEVHEKWQKAQRRNEELKTIEMKHNQMQSILKNLEALSGSSLLSSLDIEKNSSLPLNYEPRETSEPSLFDLKDYAFSKHRDTFFD